MKGIYKNLAITLIAAVTFGTSLAGGSIKHKHEDLPPELAELNIKILPKIKGISRTFSKLNKDYANRLASMFIVMKQQHGYDMTMIEGHRTAERQDSLSSGVTQAKGYQSYHQYGLAADCAFMKNGKLMTDPSDPWTMKGYKLMGEVAKSVGLVWGGNWTFKDYGHTELRTPQAKYAMSMARKGNYRNSMALAAL
ncbi:hypothetical protein ABIB38_004791 [Massilia sp. UYP11]|uniref:M15 family metallopeptidase n=1 Tax=Massilia sp. UYP11 TaxID=1756385 RepID=UPI003D219FDB